jgi:glycosyltransferase involved in cell wall biosynthesis
MRYLSVPGGWGLSTAGALLFARIVNRVRALHRQHAIDVIHAHAPLPCGHAAMLLSQELGIPYVVSVHGLDAYSDVQVSGRAGQWCRRISQLVFRSAKRVICVSEHVREQVLNGGVSGGNTSVVYNGADPKMFIPASDTAPAQTIVLSVGNLIPTKGHEVLLWALDAIKAEYPDVTCEIVGTGPERDRLKDLARHLEIDNRVRFLGRLSRRDLAEAFRRCTLFVLPSYYEGLGCVYLEAMASERVAMGCRGQGIQEIIQHGSNGWLVDAGSSQDLANGLSALLSNPTLRATIASQGRRTVLQGLTLSHQAERQVAIYREMVV